MVENKALQIPAQVHTSHKSRLPVRHSGYGRTDGRVNAAGSAAWATLKDEAQSKKYKVNSKIVNERKYPLRLSKKTTLSVLAKGCLYFSNIYSPLLANVPQSALP